MADTVNEVEESGEAQESQDEEMKATEEEISAEEVEEPKEEVEDFQAKYYYLAAEMENLRKRFEREKEGIVKYGSEKIMNGLIAVVQNFERTMDALSKDDDEKIKNIAIGIEMVHKQLLETLQTNGLEQIECVGKIFDPNFHEALAQQPAEGKEDMEIISVFEKGYTLNGRLIRAAKVIVVKN